MTIFQKLSLSVSIGLRGRPPRDPAPTERLTRYIFESGHFAASKGRVKPRALEPSSRHNCTSVYRTNLLPAQLIWAIGTVLVSPGRKKPVLARADFALDSAIQLGLTIRPHAYPPRHASIYGWPPRAPEKDAWMSLAQQLAPQCLLVLPPKPSGVQGDAHEVEIVDYREEA